MDELNMDCSDVEKFYKSKDEINMDILEKFNPNEQPESFEKKLSNLINCYSLERGSDTPDFILAQYLNDCLQAYNKAVSQRGGWLGGNP